MRAPSTAALYRIQLPPAGVVATLAFHFPDRGPYGRSDALSRQQELLVLVVAPVARPETDHRGVRGSRHPALPAEHAGDDPQILALRPGAGAQARRGDGVGKPGRLRISRRGVSDIRAVAEGHAGARR